MKMIDRQHIVHHECQWGIVRRHQTSSCAANSGFIHQNASPERSITAESIVHQVPRDTVTLAADDFLLPEVAVVVGVEAALEEPLVPAAEALPATVTCPAISAKKTWMMNTILPHNIRGAKTYIAGTWVKSSSSPRMVASCSGKRQWGQGTGTKKRGGRGQRRATLPVMRDAPHRKRRLELWVKLDRFRHREVVQLVCEHNAPDGVERARRKVANKQIVRGVDISSSDVVRPDAPVVRVILPYDSLEAQRICNIANAVL